MDTVDLGGLAVSAQGLGCMGMSEWYGPADWDQSVATIHRALELGVTFLDTADVYGDGHNEVLVGRAIHVRREQVQLATNDLIIAVTALATNRAVLTGDRKHTSATYQALSASRSVE